MVERIRICCFGHCSAWSLIFLLQLLAGAAVVTSIFLKSFVSFGGNSLSLYDSNYKDEKDIFCSDAYYNASLCKLAKGLYYGQIAYLICASVAVVVTIF